MNKTWMAAILSAFGLSALSAQAEPAKTDTYPLKTCMVSGEKLGAMDKPYVYHYQGREVQFCCKNCVADFNKDPQKYLKKLDERGQDGQIKAITGQNLLCRFQGIAGE